ncbi:MAG TPA: hypothetical protein VFS85_08950 [Dongiaceae bacterium]|jgi:hypothetical protein|nr:hypothetical protein [Dongiaceae bacterium]
MKRVLCAALLAVIAAAIPASAEDVPCEKMLADLRDALKTAKPSDADAAKIKELEDKGIERCNADDDARADEFFSQAMKILGK